MALALTGAIIGIVAPRFREATLMIFAALLAVVVGTGVLVAHDAEIWMVAVALPLLVLLVALLARALPRVATFVLLALALLLASLTVTGGSRPALWIALGLALGLLVLGTVKSRLGLLIACAVLGSCFAWGIGPLVAGLVPWSVTVAVYFAIGGLVMQRPGEDGTGPPWRACVRWVGGAAAVLALTVSGLPWLADELVPTRDPEAAERRARLQAEAPRGGLVWPLPSEAILWDAPGFPAVENLDALYLGGSSDAGLAQLPGVPLLRGRFALNGPIHRMRAIKDEREIALLRQASRATVEALRHSLPLYREGGNEGDIAESVHEYYTRHGCEGDSFPPIVASGANALDFHYMENDDALEEGEIVITDIGCYAEHYASDYTRTIPVGGRFSPRARELYDALYLAERAAAAACRAGVYLRGRETPDGSRSLDTIARDTLEAYGAPSDFGHGIGHPIGLFAHDVFQLGEPLEAGMVIMIEPGIYIEDEGIGLRLENAYLVHDTHCELLTGGIPNDAAGIERMMARAFAPSPPPSPEPAPGEAVSQPESEEVSRPESEIVAPPGSEEMTPEEPIE
jgi:hypothetical protein